MYKIVGILLSLWNVNLIPLQSVKKGISPRYPKQAIKHLENYGYLLSTTSHSNRELFEATRRLQQKLNIQRTGLFDTKTLNALTIPRCGERDFGRATQNNTQTNVTKYEYTYVVESWSNLLPLDRQNITIRNGFYHWRSVISKQIHLHWSEKNPDFRISFVKRINGSLSSMDNMMTKIQHDGNNTRLLFHFNTTTSIDMLYKATRHLFGDIFNQPHGNSRNEVMSPWISKSKPNTFSRLPLGSPAANRVCNISMKSIHAQYDEGTSYIFSGDDRHWKANGSYLQSNSTAVKLTCQHRVEKGFPNKLSTKWGPVMMDSSKLDEAFVLPHGNIQTWDTMFFMGDKFYRYISDDKKWDTKAGARKIKNWWPGIPNDIDAVFYDYELGDGSTPLYFFKGDLVYKFKLNTQSNSFGSVDPKYPMKINSRFPRAPDNLDSAYRTYCSGDIFLFKGNLFWKWDGLEAKGPYPINTLIHDFCV